MRYTSCRGNIFKGSKDLETAGIAYFDLDLNNGFLGLEIEETKEIIANSIRVLFRGKLWVSRRGRQQTSAPRILQEYLRKVAAKTNLEFNELIEAVGERLRSLNIINQNWLCIVDPDTSGLRLAKVKPEALHTCEKCNLVTTKTKLKVCISASCFSDSFRTGGRLEQDYFSWVSKKNIAPLRVQELTGQTKPPTDKESGKGTLKAFSWQTKCKPLKV